MDFNEINRYKTFLQYLVNIGFAPDQRSIGQMIGYNNPSAFSQVINGKKQMPKEFTQKLKSIYPDLNINWLLTGEGDMLGSAEIDATKEVGTIPKAEGVEIWDQEDYEKAVKSGMPLIPEYDMAFRGGNIGEANPNLPFAGYWHIPGIGKDSFIVSVSGDSMSPILPNGAKILITPYYFDRSCPTSIPFGQIFAIEVQTDEFSDCKEYYVKYLRRHTDTSLSSRFWIARSANRSEYDDFDIEISKVNNLWLVNKVIHNF